MDLKELILNEETKTSQEKPAERGGGRERRGREGETGEGERLKRRLAMLVEAVFPRNSRFPTLPPISGKRYTFVHLLHFAAKPLEKISSFFSQFSLLNRD